ncbi:hypothetical protein [Desulfobacter curvatus]|uniref:hypothetical protein n=1 Tax=Desulfobacter curvatus TaxID=2290 RepID=UPI00036BEE7D|nr:hypothetical protein [Desulfobacter curvatus]
MARDFAITTVNSQIELKKGKKSSVSYTVTNSRGTQLTARARISPLEGADESWFTIEGESERVFAENDTHQYSVSVNIPAEIERGSYKFKLDVFSVENPDEIFSEGPVIEILISEAPIDDNNNDKPFPWWIIAVIAAVILIGGGIIWYVISNKPQPKPEPEPESVKIEIPCSIKGKKYEQAFELLNNKGIKYQVFTTEKTKKSIENTISARTVAPAAPSNLTVTSRPAIRPITVFPVVVDTDPKCKTKIDPDQIVKVYFGEKTSAPYVRLEKTFLEFKAGMNKELLKNLDTVHRVRQ